ncbi:chorismate mutase [Candidatus Nitrosocosmicus sp. T]
MINCSSLGEIRKNIDSIDMEIVLLLVRRGKYVQQAAKFKSNYSKIEDKKRIDEILDKVTNYSRELDFDSTVIEKIYSFMIEVYIQFEKKKFLNP